MIYFNNKITITLTGSRDVADPEGYRGVYQNNILLGWFDVRAEPRPWVHNGRVWWCCYDLRHKDSLTLIVHANAWSMHTCTRVDCTWRNVWKCQKWKPDHGIGLFNRAFWVNCAAVMPGKKNLVSDLAFHSDDLDILWLVVSSPV